MPCKYTVHRSIILCYPVKVLVLACLCVTNCFPRQNKTENKSVAKVVLQSLQYSSRCKKRKTGGEEKQIYAKTNMVTLSLYWKSPSTRHASMIPVTTATMQETFFIFTVWIRLFDGLKDQRRRTFSALKHFFHVVCHAYSPQGIKKRIKQWKNTLS
jgi:hypothetical protein